MASFQHDLVELLRYVGPFLGAIVLDEANKYLVLEGRPLGLVAALLLDELPAFLTFLCVFRWHNLGNLLPVSIFEVLHKLTILDHESEQTVLEQVRLVVFPLRQGPLALSRIIPLIYQLFEYFHGVLV